MKENKRKTIQKKKNIYMYLYLQSENRKERLEKGFMYKEMQRTVRNR